MDKVIHVNGRPEVVLNSYSAGPGETPYMYDIRGGYVYKAGGWFLQRPGHFAQSVSVVAVVCAWCSPDAPTTAGLTVSHDICPACLARVESEGVEPVRASASREQ